MEHALEIEGLVRDVEVVNSPGAGGAIGLAQFVSAARGNSEALIVGGHVMLGAIRLNQAAVSLLDTTPIARLTTENLALVVASSSPFQTLEDLLAAMKTNATALTWAGGSAGGTEHALAVAIAATLGIAAERVRYLSFPGGNAPIEALLSRKADIGAVGYGEIHTRLGDGSLRALALSAFERIPGTSVPTLRERGVAVAMENWRGVFAPPDISETARTRFDALVGAMAKTPTWQASLSERHWSDRYLDGPQFIEFLREQHEGEAVSSTRTPIPQLLGRERVEASPIFVSLILPAALAIALIAIAAALIWWLRRSSPVASVLSNTQTEEALTAPAEPRDEAQVAGRDVLRNLEEEIDREFEKWALTVAEREIALLMLKGFRHKEIAKIRETSERTVRQQAASIYRKAGVHGRAEFAAYFFEDRLVPTNAEGLAVQAVRPAHAHAGTE